MRDYSHASVSSPDGLDRELGLSWTEARAVEGNRVRHPSGAEMELLHLDVRGTQLFAVFHKPPGPPRGIVVVCSPPYAEAARNQRREILLGWQASRRDLAVVRFHVRGGGHSGGETATMTLETMQEDALAVAREAVERLEAPLVGFVGTRLGAVVAHRVAAAHPGTAVVWWHPVLDADSYVRELVRASMIGALKRGVTTSARELEARLESEGVLDVLGSPVSRCFYDSLFVRPLDDAPPGPRSGLVVQMSRHAQLQRPCVTLIDKLRREGWTVSSLLIPNEETWWFGARGRGVEFELRSVALRAVSATVEFFEST